jgi:hypothetical protein
MPNEKMPQQKPGMGKQQPMQKPQQQDPMQAKPGAGQQTKKPQ